jgi:hypothetical protein
MPTMINLPPTVYSLLESIVNYGKDEKTKIKDLAKEGRTTFFDFDYPLTNNITKEQFETMILNKFIMRRIGYDTLTAFKLQLNVKLNSIMPIYNKMFDALENWNIFESGEVTTETGTDERQTTNTTQNTLSNSSTTQSSSTSDRRNSELPQDQLENLRDGSYVGVYNYDTDTATGTDSSTSNGTATASGTDNNEYTKEIRRSPADKIAIMKEMQENINSIYEMIFKDLECLFYQLA